MDLFSVLAGVLAPFTGMAGDELNDWANKDTVIRQVKDELNAIPGWFTIRFEGGEAQGTYDAQRFITWFENRDNYKGLYDLLRLSGSSYNKKLQALLNSLNLATSAATDEQENFNLQKIKSTEKLMGQFYEKLLPPESAYIVKIVRENSTKDTDVDEAWEDYKRYLEKGIEENVFGESFSIKDLYIPLCGHLGKDVSSSQGNHFQTYEGERETDLLAVDIEAELKAWLAGEEYPVCALIGGPGSGKSTVAKVFAAKTSRYINVVYAPLWRLSNWSSAQSVPEILNSYFENSSPYKPGSLDFREQSLLILDGVDELKVASRDIDHFLDLVSGFIEGHPNTKVLLSSREHVAYQIDERLTRIGTRKLYLLGYKVDRPDYFIDPKGLLKVDRRDLWWKRYAKLKGLDCGGLPKEVADWDAKEKLTYQPLLNYLVAITFTYRNDTFSSETSLYGLYRNLVETVFNRSYEKEKHNSLKTLNVSLKDYLEFLSIAALAVWHKGGRSAPYEHLEQYCQERSSVKQVFDSLVGDSNERLISLLVSFFSKPADGHSYEFTHMSFMEFLVVHALLIWLEELQDNTDQALQKWGEIAGPQPLTPHMLDFLKAAIIDEGHPAAQEKASLVKDILTLLMKDGLPLAGDDLMPGSKKTTFYAQYKREQNAEASLFVLLGVMQSTVTDKYSLDCFFNQATAHSTYHEWQLFIGNKNCNNTNAALLGFSLKSEHSAYLLRLSTPALYRANLKFVNLSSADLRGANLKGANLKGADLGKTNLKGAILIGANLREANLRGADLGGADLDGADLGGADLREANLWDASLGGVYLGDTNLTGADLMNADLRSAHLTGAHLTGADLRGADLRSADLRDANLIGANLDGANTYNAKGLQKT